MNNNNSLLRHLAWLVVAIVGAAALGVVALRRGEAINALWIVVAAVAIYLVAYRYYSLFIASKVMQLDPNRATPAVLNNDGLDYVPTNKHILFGHHFAAIAGAGPLVGPVLAAQMGYLPGTLWLIAGVVLAGAVQDFMVLFISSRRNGRSLGELVREEMGQVAGTIALFGAFLIMIIILAVLALIVVKALADSPWGMFTVLATIPIALFMGVYMRFIRPGRIGEISIIGVFLLLGSIWLGGQVAASPEWAPHFTFSGIQITWMLIGYGAVASVLPVWLLLAPRDYLSTFLKIGTIIGLAIGILIVMPELKMPALTQFTDGTGPVWKGSLFPFLFITIACGAVSGFHALISSGTTPKLLNREPDARYIGYGGMLMESFVAIMAMVAASVIEPGIYFAMNSPPAVVGADVNAVAATVSSWGFAITPEQLTQTAQDIGETTILARAGGAPTLAEKAVGAGFPGEQVDGNDVLAVAERVRAALERARQGKGPTLLECISYRLCDHTTADDASRYRSAEEVNQAWREEPIKRLRAFLAGRGQWDEEREQALVGECQARVQEAVERFETFAAQAPQALFEHVYARWPAVLEEQREQLLERAARRQGGAEHE
ncbi:carbon starvation CstA family protein [Pseudomonas aeruginosa]